MSRVRWSFFWRPEARADYARAVASKNQLEIYRQVLRRLDPTRPIKAPTDKSWYVARPDGVGHALARSLQIEPQSSHLVVGSIGSGKSSELLAAGRELLETRGVFARYVEVSQITDLESGDAESLLLAVGHELLLCLESTAPDDLQLESIRAQLAPLVDGYSMPVDALSDDSDRVSIEPRVHHPTQGVPAPVAEHLPILRELAGAVRRLRQGDDLVFLLDGLDRLSDPVQFDALMEPCLRALGAAGIGVAATGPRRAVSGVDRLGVAEGFDELHWVGPLAPDEGGEGFRFLNGVLEARGVDQIMGADARHEVVRLSGGSLRILLQLAREAIKETWVRNAELLGPDQVRAASDRVGRGLLLGLTDRDLGVLSAVQTKGTFSPRSPEDEALAWTNRVLEYRTPSGLMEHRIHPTLLPFLTAWTAHDQAGDSRGLDGP